MRLDGAAKKRQHEAGVGLRRRLLFQAYSTSAFFIFFIAATSI
jgi:hypothetical protein